MHKDANPETIVKLLSHTPLFQALASEQLTQISEGTQIVRLDKGEILFHAGETPTGLYVVAFGQIKLLITSPLGDEKVVEIITPNQSFGEAVMFLQRPYPVTAVALADALLLKIPQLHVDHILSTTPSFAKLMLAGLSLRLRSLVQDVESYSMRSSAQRVIGYLLQHCPENCLEETEVDLPTSKLVIASRLNLTPETLSRVFQELSRNKLINVHGRSIQIPCAQRLREYMG